MGSLRVISGSAKGLRLKSVPGNTTRPITDQVKEALFNILTPYIEESLWLDLFAGSGAVGIEALSRGAQFVTFLDISYQAVKIIHENLKATRFQNVSSVLKKNAFYFLTDTPSKAYDYVFIAPPQYAGLWEKALNLLDENPGWVSEEGEAIVQINPQEYKFSQLKHFSEVSQHRYGDTLLIFYRKISSNRI